MSTDYMLLNLDTGDVLSVGKQRTYPAVPEIGIVEEHTFFDGIPHYESDTIPRFEDYYRTSGHALNFFLAHSRGCRIIVMSIQELSDIFDEFNDETPGEGVLLGGAMHIQNARQGAPYFARRLQHTKALPPKTDAEREARETRALQYRDEIKALIKANLAEILNKANEPRIIYQAGEMDPDPVFVPWDDLPRRRK